MPCGLIAAMSRPCGQAAPLRASIEKDLRELLGVVLHARTQGLPALQLAMARLVKAALDVDAAGSEVGSCSVTVPPITRGKRLGRDSSTPKNSVISTIKS